MEHPSLTIEVRPNLQGEYILTPKDADSTTLLHRLAEEGNRVLLLDLNEWRRKVLLDRYPLDPPLDAVEEHPQVASAQHLYSWRDKLPPRQVLLGIAGQMPAKLDIGCWGKYSLDMEALFSNQATSQETR